MSKTSELLGTTKRIRAVADLVYLGRSIRGKRTVRVDGAHGSYEIVHTPGEELECDQDYAKGVIQSGAAEYLAGGLCTVIVEPDGFNRYVGWNSPYRGAPVYEKIESIRMLSFGGLFLPPGFRCKLDINLYDRTQLRYDDDAESDTQQLRVLKPSPKKVRISQAEQAGKVNAIYEKLFPAGHPAT